MNDFNLCASTRNSEARIIGRIANGSKTRIIGRIAKGPDYVKNPSASKFRPKHTSHVPEQETKTGGDLQASRRANSFE